MKKILIILSLFVACVNKESKVETADKAKQEERDSSSSEVHIALQLNNGAKWKTDVATRKNVAAMAKIINDSSNAGTKNRKLLVRQLQTSIDTLVQQCTMKGPSHDALHLWLEKVLNDLKGMTAGDDKFQNAYASLRKNVDSFYVFFE